MTTRNRLDNNLCGFADTVIFVRAANIENLIVDHFSGSFEHAENRSGDVANVDDGPASVPSLLI
ncbi:MAG: hypothetical protein WCD43_02175 [Candidatus Acidiferrales bacterium]